MAASMPKETADKSSRPQIVTPRAIRSRRISGFYQNGRDNNSPPTGARQTQRKDTGRQARVPRGADGDKALARKLDVNQPGRPSRNPDYSGLRAATVAREILSEGKPMTLVELTVEVQRRGCRSLDDPRAVAHAISALLYRPGQFRKDERGRWLVE